MDEDKILIINDKYISKGIIRTDENGDITYKVVDRTTGEIYSLKTFDHNFDSSEREQIKLDFQIFTQLDHTILVRCHDMWEMADGKIHILLDYVGHEYVSATNLSIRDESQLANISRQLLLGLDYLHSKHICHGNVKNSNILIDLSTNQLKVLYLGKTLFRIPVDGDGLEVLNGVYWDIWNLGLSVLKLYMGSGRDDLKLDVHFKQQLTNVKSRDDFQSGKRKRSMDEVASFVDLPAPVLNSSKDMWNFLRCCMETDVSNRWNTTRLLKHPFIHCSSRIKSSLTTSVDISTETSNIFSSMSSPPSSVMSSPWPIQDLSSEDDKNKRPKLSFEYNTEDLEDGSDIFDDDDTTHIHPFFDDFEIAEDTLNAYDKCIQHCSLFPQDFEFDMDKVVQLWIAEGCINEDERMEDVAKSYFEDLLEKEFIIPKKLDVKYGKMIYKLNISKFSHKDGTDGDYLRVCEVTMDEILRASSARHLSFHCKTFDPKIFDSLKDFKNLRTLLFLGESGCRLNLLPNTMFVGLKLLRSLDLSFTSILELPSAIGNLESLRCLDVSETPIKHLPESTDRLTFLQTVRLRGCVGVRSLPKKLEKLINLRHLDLDIVRQLKSMPKGMGSLIKLQTLHAFLVGKNDRCGIGELENLNNITGSFCISGLENVSSVDEAKQAMLGNKKHLDMLELRWSDHINENSLMNVEILECLQPHFGIKEIKILCYKGSKLPCWISNPSFTNLANITLYKCLNCHILPSVGELPSLRSLTIVEMNSLRDIDSIFCRNYGTLGSGAFRSLEKLTLDNMLSLEKWTGLENGDFVCLRHIAIRYCPKLSILPVLSRLRSLLYFEISHCSQLISLPERGMPSSLETLIVRACPNINEGCIKDEQDRCKIAHVANIWIDFKKISLD